jgi:hypothetical protein
MEKWSDPDPGSGIKHPGSATLPERLIKLKRGKKHKQELVP